MNIEAWASLFGELAMAMYRSIWELPMESADERVKSNFLLHRPCVLWLEVITDATDVADAYGVGVVTDTMCAGNVEWSAFLDLTIEEHNVMVAYAVTPLFSMPSIDVRCREVPPFLGGRAVDDDFSDFSHFSRRI